MGTGKLGQILALIGLMLVVIMGWGRRRVWGQKQPSAPAGFSYQFWGGLAGFLLILAGLVLMNYHR
jgi:hypothetical protein